MDKSFYFRGRVYVEIIVVTANPTGGAFYSVGEKKLKYFYLIPPSGKYRNAITISVFRTY